MKKKIEKRVFFSSEKDIFSYLLFLSLIYFILIYSTAWLTLLYMTIFLASFVIYIYLPQPFAAVSSIYSPNLRLPDIALAIVAASAKLKSEPTGTPAAIRVSATPIPPNSCAR